jgi:hypothetical protein
MRTMAKYHSQSRINMHRLLLVIAIAFLPGLGNATGCLKGAAVGGVVGHVAGHHAVAGAAVGCVIGHHRAKVKDREAAQAAQSQARPTASSGASPNQ